MVFKKTQQKRFTPEKLKCSLKKTNICAKNYL